MPQFLVELEDGRKFNVESDIAPTEDDINDFMSAPAAAPAPVSAPSETFLGQSAQKLATGTRQALAGAKTTLSAATGLNETAGRGLSELAAAGRQSQDERTPQDIAFANEMAQNAKEFDAASGVMGKAGEFLDYAGIAARNPRAAFQMGLQSVPNALISIPAAALGKAAGAAAGLAAGIESGPGAVATGAAGMAAGSIGANILMEGGGAIADKISAATNGASANWTPEQFTAFLDANPDIVKAGLKSGVVRGGVIGTVDALSMGLAGRVMKPAMGASSRAAIAARGAAATGIEMGSEGAGEALAGYVDTGKVDSEAVAQEILGGVGTGVPSALVGRSLSAIRPGAATDTLAPVADPLAAAAASFTEPQPTATQPTATAPTATPPPVESRSWNVELSDGRKFIVDSDIEPTVADIETFLASPDAEAIGPAPAITEESSVVQPPASVNAAIPTVPQSGAATVDEGIAGSTPASGAISPPLATRQVPVIEDSPYGGRDILDFVNDRPIVIPETARGGDMDWAERAGLPKEYAKFLAIPGEASNINEVAQDAFDANLIDDTTPDALMAKIQEVITSRENAKADAKTQQSQMNQAEKARILFDKAVARTAKAKTGTQRIEIDAMNKGDVLTLGGETMTVVAQDVNEDGFNQSVTLRSESGRLGTVTLTADTPALSVENYTPRPTREASATNAGSDWADGIIAASMETPFIGLDPQLMAAYAVKGAQLIREGFTTFTQWSAEMLRRFGEAVRNYLQDVWRMSEGGFVGTGGMPNPAAGPQPSTPPPVSLAQADVAAERQADGKSALPTGNQFTVAGLEAAARAEVQIPGRVAALMADLKETLRATEPLETYILLNYKGALEAELSEVEPILADPTTDPTARAAAAQRKLDADAKLDNLELISQLSRSKAGGILGAMSRPLSRDGIPTLNKMIADITLIMDPTGRTPLPPEERAKIEELHTTIVETKAAADKQEEEGVAGAKNTYNLELEKLLKEAQDLIKQQEEELAIQKRVIENKANPVKLKTKNKGLLSKWAADGDMALEELRASGLFKQANSGIARTPAQILAAARLIRGVLSKGLIASADAAAILVQKIGAANFPVFERFMPQIIDKVNTLQDDDIKELRPDKEDIKAKAKKTVLAGGKVPANLARQFALAHIIDHLNRKDKTLSAEKIAKLVSDDLQEFFPGIKERQARDLISGYGKSSKPSKEEARVQMRDLAAQMQKLTQLEALLNKEKLLKSGPQRQEPSARLRELQKQVEQLKKDTGYQSRSREDELRSIRDRIQKQLQNQIEELQRVLSGQAVPTAPRQRQIYDANLQAMQTLRNSLKVLVAELPQHRLASELRRNAAAEAAARASEAEYKRRIAAKEWKAEGKAQGPQTQAVTEARDAAAVARQHFLHLKRAAQPTFDPNVRELAAFKKRIQSQITKLNERIAKGEFEPVKRTPRQIKHDEQSAKLLTELNKAKRAFIDAKVAAKFAKMGLFDKGIEKLRTFVFTARSLMAGGEFSGIGRQGLLKALSHPVRFVGDLKAMKQAFKSEEGETAMFKDLYARPNAINGRYKRAKLALHNPDDYSDLLAEGAARSKFANQIPWFSHTGRAYTALLSHMRADLFDSLVAKYEKRTKTEISDTAAAAIAEFVNDSTGSGKLGIGKIELRGNQKDLASLIFFSPSFMASRLRVLTGASLLGGNFDTRRIIAEEYIRIMAGYAALFALAAALQGDDEEEMELDPRGGGWLKMDFGATSVDLMAGLNSMATFLTRTITGDTKTKDGIKPIRGENVPMGQSWLDIAVRFGRGKFSPSASFVTNRLTGTDPMGNKETALQGLQRAVTPITFGAAWDAAMQEPINRSAALIPAAFLGVGTNTKRPKDASFIKDLGRMTGFNR